MLAPDLRNPVPYLSGEEHWTELFGRLNRINKGKPQAFGDSVCVCGARQVASGMWQSGRCNIYLRQLEPAAHRRRTRESETDDTGLSLWQLKWSQNNCYNYCLSPSVGGFPHDNRVGWTIHFEKNLGCSLRSANFSCFGSRALDSTINSVGAQGKPLKGSQSLMSEWPY